MKETGFRCQGKMLHLGEIVAEHHMVTDNSGKSTFQLTYWKIIEHGGQFWRRSCDSDSNELLLTNLDLHFSIADPKNLADPVDTRPQNIMVDSAQSVHRNHPKHLYQLCFLLLAIYLIARVIVPYPVVSYAIAIACAIITFFTIKSKGEKS